MAARDHAMRRRTIGGSVDDERTCNSYSVQLANYNYYGIGKHRLRGYAMQQAQRIDILGRTQIRAAYDTSTTTV